jgi:hypothetical protein
MLRFRNIDTTQVDSGQEGLELKLPVRELGRELRLEKEETVAITEACPNGNLG